MFRPRIVGFLPFQRVDMPVENVLEEGGQPVQTARGLASDRGHHELDVAIPVKSAKYVRLDAEQRVVKPLLTGGERNGYGLRISDGESPDIAPPRPVEDARECVQCLDVRDELDSLVDGDAGPSKSMSEPVKFGIVLENRSSPRRCGGLVEGLCGPRCPIRLLGASDIRGPVDKRVWLCHVLKTLLIPDEIRAQCIQQDEQVMVAQLDGGSGQENRRLCVVAEKPHALVGVGALVADVMGFIHDHEIKARRRVQVQQPFSVFSPAFAF